MRKKDTDIFEPSKSPAFDFIYYNQEKIKVSFHGILDLNS